MSELIHPHDKFFKETFSRPELARDFLRNYLPKTAVSLLDLDSLTVESDSFIDPELQEQFADLLYKVNLRSGGEAYVYTLIEHKSNPEILTPLQLLRYMVSIWTKDQRKKMPLRPIIPIVLYHGRASWNAPINFAGLFSGDEALRPYWPSFTYELQNLNNTHDNEITGEAQLRIGLLVLKYIAAPELNGRLVEILTLFEDVSETATAVEYLRTVLYYISKAGRYVEQTDVVTAVQTVLDDGGNEIMQTIADHWIEQGVDRGIEQGFKQGIDRGIEQGLRRGIDQGIEQGLRRGIDQGIEQGFTQGKKDVARRLLALHDAMTVSEITGLSIEDVVALQETT